MNIIPIALTFNEKYVIHSCSAIFSMLENADKSYYYKIYVLYIDNSISRNSQAKILSVVKKFNNAEIKFINVTNLFYEKFAIKTENLYHYSKEIFIKLLIPVIFNDYEKVIISDVDVIFTGDISQIYKIDIKNYYLAGIPMYDKKMYDYVDSLYQNFEYKNLILQGIGAGFVIYNIDNIKADKIFDKFTKIFNTNVRLYQPEQDILNIACSGKILHLPQRFMLCTYSYNLVSSNTLTLSTNSNWFNYYSKKYLQDIKNVQFINNVTEEELYEAFSNPIQIHYATHIKPWNVLFCFQKFIYLKYIYKSGSLIEYVSKFETKNLIKYLTFFHLIKRVMNKLLRLI